MVKAMFLIGAGALYAAAIYGSSIDSPGWVLGGAVVGLIVAVIGLNYEG